MCQEYIRKYMSCNKPLLGEYTGDLLPSGKREVKIYGRYDRLLADQHPGAFPIPCGMCNGCRADYARNWADRMILELDHSKKAVFVTLTYNDEHLPVMYNITTGQAEITLKKRDVQLFMKRLRKQFRDRELRYYIAGEYGAKGRSHYHAIIYGIGLEDFPDLQLKGNNQLGHMYYKSDWLAEKVWKNGFCLIANVSWKSCAYVARYVNKKQFGLVSDEFIDRMREPTFAVSSRNPGIGMYYPIEHPEYKDKSNYYFSDENGSVMVRFPKVFLKFLENNDPEIYQEMKKERMIYAKDTEFLKLKNTDLLSSELDELSENQISKSQNVIEFYRSI